MPEEKDQAKSMETQLNTLEKLIHWIISKGRGKSLKRKLLLLDILIVTLLNKFTVSSFLKIFGAEEILNNIPYVLIWALVIAVIFIIAVIAAFKDIERKERSGKDDFPVRSPLKGLFSFEPEDAEIYTQMQREGKVKECLRAAAHTDFRYGIITGKSGSGKTSFVRAGLEPNFPKLNHRCVYVKFTNLPPIKSIRLAICP